MPTFQRTNKLWSPYTTKVPTSGILDSAADMHNAPLESVKEVVGSMKIRTVTGTKEVPVGYQELPGFRTNAPAEVVGTTKHILSLPQALREKRIVGFFQGDRVPDEVEEVADVGMGWDGMVGVICNGIVVSPKSVSPKKY